ncbi:MAG: G-D-S-L family lipolytic protein [Flavobacteriaceae bacterium]|nr:MAG: G-D-S-L family lipolytic protein [Flavobacteriaceae bacterium]
MKKISIAVIALCAFTFVGCDDEDYLVLPEPVDEINPVVDNTVYTSGEADFSTFVSVGNSLTAGYSDGALFTSGQESSFPNILATQFALAGGGAFSQPLMSDDLGGLLLGGNQIAENRFYLNFDPVNGPGPVRLGGTPTTEVSTVLSGPFNNMGVPGAKSYHLGFSGYGNVGGIGAYANPYYVRMATSPGATVMGDVMAQSPTFFSLWIGNNDVLSYALAGGDGVDQLGNYVAATYGGNDISDPLVFAGVYAELLQALTSGGAKGVVATLPNVTTIPYFTTVPHNSIPLDAATAGMLNQAFAAYNGGLQFVVDNTPYLTQEEADRRMISFKEGLNPVLILDENLTDLTEVNSDLTNMRQATEADLLVLPAMSFLGTLVGGNPQLINGVSVPLVDKWVLTPEEQDQVNTAQIAYNESIKALATQHGLALFDAASLLTTLIDTGITQNGITTTGVFATGGGFSLDGVHPSPRGYAILANGMIEAINTTYQSNLPNVDVGDYKGVYIQ